MDLGISSNVAPLLDDVKGFIESEILPVEMDYYADIAVGDRWEYTDRQNEIRESLKEKALFLIRRLKDFHLIILNPSPTNINHHWSYPFASSMASALHGYHITGLCACCLKYRL